MFDPRAAAAVPSRARRPRLGRRALLAGLLGGGAVALLDRLPTGPGSAAGVAGPAASATIPAGPSADRAAERGRDVVDPDAATVAQPAPPAPTSAVLATLDGLTLHVPALAPVLVAYHEASTVRARPLAPLGRLRTNANTTRFDEPPADPRGVAYDVQVSRGRAAAATSAVDVVLEQDEVVLAPVAGTVVEVRDYRLYGRHEDVRVELRPDGHDDLAVVLIHVRDPLVAAGQRVVTGEPLAAAARVFPFHSIVDAAVAPRRLGHVHLEVSTPRAEEPSDV